jgi:hypothetical protein
MQSVTRINLETFNLYRKPQPSPAQTTEQRQLSSEIVFDLEENRYPKIKVKMDSKQPTPRTLFHNDNLRSPSNQASKSKHCQATIPPQPTTVIGRLSYSRTLNYISAISPENVAITFKRPN